MRLTVAALAVLIAGCASSPSADFSFALIGDLGYMPAQEPMVDRVLRDINGQALAFVVPEGDAEYAARNAADIAWLRQGFAAARASRGLMIIQQANIFPEFPPFPGGKPQEPSGFTELRAALEQEATAFGKPIVLVHGDSH